MLEGERLSAAPAVIDSAVRDECHESYLAERLPRAHPQPPPSILTTASNGNSGYRPTLSMYLPTRKNVGTTSSGWA